MVARLKRRRFRDEGLDGWIRKIVNKHRRKVPRWYDTDDLIQEGYLCYWRCVLAFREPYTDGPNDDRRTFMSYFIRAFGNRLCDLAKKQRETLDVTASDMSNEDTVQLDRWQTTAAVPSEAPLAVILLDSPSEVRDGIDALIAGETDLDAKYWHRGLVEKVLPSGSTRYIITKRRVRETTDQRYTRCLGKRGVPELVRSYLVDA